MPVADWAGTSLQDSHWVARWVAQAPAAVNVPGDQAADLLLSSDSVRSNGKRKSPVLHVQTLRWSCPSAHRFSPCC